MATRPAPAVSADASRLDPSVHPAVIGSVAPGPGLRQGQHPEPAASSTRRRHRCFTWRSRASSSSGSSMTTRSTRTAPRERCSNSLRRRHYRFRYTREPDLPLDQAARRMLYSPGLRGMGGHREGTPGQSGRGGASFQQERKAFDEALLEEAIALDLVEREPALCGHMRGWIFYALEIWLFIGIMPRLGCLHPDRLLHRALDRVPGDPTQGDTPHGGRRGAQGGGMGGSQADRGPRPARAGAA